MTMKATVNPGEVHAPKTLRPHWLLGIARILRRFAWMMLALPLTAQAQFQYIVTGGSITLTGYACTAGALNIPSTIDGLPVTAIGSGVFLNCSNLTKVTIPSGVTHIGPSAFYGCTRLGAIEVDAVNPAYSSVDGVLFDHARTTLLQYPGAKSGSYAIPGSVTAIGDYAFFGCRDLTGVTIGDGVTNVGNHAFSGCRRLTGIPIPNGVTTIGDHAFQACSGLKSILLPSGVTRIGEYTLAGCRALTSVIVPEGATHIGRAAFSGCHSLTSVRIPNAVTSIGLGAFFGCSGLASVTIGTGVTSIGDIAFNHCTGLINVHFQGNAPPAPVALFDPAARVSVYYLPGTTGWDLGYAGRPTALWSSPLIHGNGPGPGVGAAGFGFLISWAPDATVVVEACTDLTNPVWLSFSTNTLSGGTAALSDPQWAEHPTRFYRARTP